MTTVLPLYSIMGYMAHTISLKDENPFRLMVWSLFEENLTWQDAKKKRKESGLKGLHIVPQNGVMNRKDAKKELGEDEKIS